MKTPWINFAEISRQPTHIQTIIVSSVAAPTDPSPAEDNVVAEITDETIHLHDESIPHEQVQTNETMIEQLVHILQQVQQRKQKDDFTKLVSVLKQVQMNLIDRQQATTHQSSLSSVPEKEQMSDREAMHDKPTEDERISNETGFVYQKSIQTPISTVVEIDHFHRTPLFPDHHHYTFEWNDNRSGQNPQLETTFVSSTTYYPDQPYCELVYSKIHETLFLSTTKDLKKQHQLLQSTATPLHPTLSKEKEYDGKKTHEHFKIRVPVVVGEYKIETCLTEDILFEHEPIQLKSISKHVVLTKCHFSPANFSHPLDNGLRVASKGLLSLEGYVDQMIEYTAATNHTDRLTSNDRSFSLHVMMVLEIWIHLLQIQGVDIYDHRMT